MKQIFKKNVVYLHCDFKNSILLILKNAISLTI